MSKKGQIETKPPVPPEFGSKYILIECGGDGGTVIEACGFNGIGCKAATKPFEDALGGKVIDSGDKGPEGPTCITNSR